MAHHAADNPDAAKDLASTLLGQLGVWDACLLWATEWDVWIDKEDWPRFYCWRSQHNEKRSLAAAPGHLFLSGEAPELERLLSHALQCGWDTVVLPTRSTKPTGIRLRTSHDEWVEFTREER